jgi:hypothetical protein
VKRKVHLLIVATVVLVGLAGAGPSAAADNPATSTNAEAQAPGTEIVAYYFHGNLRCKTCKALEAFSEEAISEGFADQLSDRSLVSRVVNTDEPENKHFVTDFELVTKALVLVEYRDGEVTRFEDLKLIWQLVRDKDGFLKYVRDATREFIGES